MENDYYSDRQSQYYPRGGSDAKNGAAPSPDGRRTVSYDPGMRDAQAYVDSAYERQNRYRAETAQSADHTGNGAAQGQRYRRPDYGRTGQTQTAQPVSGTEGRATSRGTTPVRGKPWMAVKIVAVAVIILFLGIKGFLTPDREISELENRTLQTKPPFSFTSVANGSYMSRFESYMSDQIPGRDGFVSTKSVLQRLVGKTEQNGVYIGKKGWLFEKPSVFSDEKTGETINAINAFCDAHLQQNISFFLVPNSTEIVKKRLPAAYRPESQSQQIEKVYSMLSDSVDLKIDAVGCLKDCSDPESLYYKTDHHWTTAAAKILFDSSSELFLPAGSEATQYDYYTVTNDFSGTLASSSGIHETTDSISVVLPVSGSGDYVVTNPDAGVKTASLFSLDKLGTKNKYEVFLGGNFSKIVVDTTVKNNRVLLMFKDSYANCFIPLLTPYYSKIIVVDARYSTDRASRIFLTYDVTDIMFLYNVNTFLEDVSLKDVLA